MILAKAFILGLAGGIIGFFAGNYVAGYFGREIFKFTALNIRPIWQLFYYCLIIFPALWMLSSWVPALIASKMDAAKILGQEY